MKTGWNPHWLLVPHPFPLRDRRPLVAPVGLEESRPPPEGNLCRASWHVLPCDPCCQWKRMGPEWGTPEGGTMPFYALSKIERSLKNDARMFGVQTFTEDIIHHKETPTFVTAQKPAFNFQPPKRNSCGCLNPWAPPSSRSCSNFCLPIIKVSSRSSSCSNSRPFWHCQSLCTTLPLRRFRVTVMEEFSMDPWRQMSG